MHCLVIFQFNIAVPVTFLACVIFLLVVPLYAAPYDTGMGLVCVASGIPVYLIGVAWKSKPKVIKDYICKYFLVTRKIVLLFMNSMKLFRLQTML